MELGEAVLVDETPKMGVDRWQTLPLTFLMATLGVCHEMARVGVVCMFETLADIFRL